MLRVIHVRSRRVLRRLAADPQLRTDASYVLHFTRNWIHYGWMTMIATGVAVAAVKSLFA